MLIYALTATGFKYELSLVSFSLSSPLSNSQLVLSDKNFFNKIDDFQNIEITKSGFINFLIKDVILQNFLFDILKGTPFLNSFTNCDTLHINSTLSFERAFVAEIILFV